MSLQNILAAKRQEQKDLAIAGAISSSILTGGIKTGMQGSSSFPAPVSFAPVEAIPFEINKEKSEVAIAVYADNNFRPLRKYAKAGGATVHSYKGYFYAQDAEDIFILDHHVKSGLLQRL